LPALGKWKYQTTFATPVQQEKLEEELDLLKSLILNLIDNALKSMNSGGILTVEDRATQEGAKIYISDTGCGMPKDEIS
ncbi:ATP-binding protein, partial [Vibrio parahaemolyticus]|nr:ATP-binding protein [Vibrio parahaemolyticus]